MKTAWSSTTGSSVSGSVAIRVRNGKRLYRTRISPRVTAIVESQAFQQMMSEGFACPDVASEERFDFGLHFERNTYGSNEDVTDCVQAATPNQPLELHTILAAY